MLRGGKQCTQLAEHYNDYCTCELKSDTYMYVNVGLSVSLLQLHVNKQHSMHVTGGSVE